MQGDTQVHTPATVSTFTQLYGSTPSGARLARRHVEARMDVWGYERGGEANEHVTLVVAELAANAVRHGRVRGRGFRVRLVLCGDVVRVEVMDARAEQLPTPAGESTAQESDEGGRGLLLVGALAEKWGVEPRPDGIYKTVWAKVLVGLPVSGSARTPLPACPSRRPSVP
ncbi:ATP-binding protein [Streptomyces sp. YU58]|uniref:ATP-binding protein n=1 Tax=Streptomyces sp. SX92 TaxID=3158972 RepID=UPI0027B9283F|nr:ATP-binding protein [Streptomyces coralus]WLW51312.1 ATP-binding protein [Streptomyces coralus]